MRGHFTGAEPHHGLLPATNRNYRDYSTDHLATLTIVRRARVLGFNRAQVRQLLTLSDRADKPCGDVDRLVEGQTAEVDRRIADLYQLLICRHGSCQFPYSQV